MANTIKPDPPGKILKMFIRKQKLTQAEFGAILGVTQGMVGKWIRSEIAISAESAVKIQKLCGLNAWELCPILEVMKPKPTHEIIDADTGKIICLAQIEEAIDVGEVKVNIRPIGASV